MKTCLFPRTSSPSTFHACREPSLRRSGLERLGAAALVAAFALLGAAASLDAADPPIRTLIFSGQNNHDWKTTTPKLKSILAATGRFAIEVTEHPEQCTAETFAKYDLVVSDWNAWGDARVKEWPAATRAAFLDFIRSGKGHVAIHAGASSFYDWPEYQQIGGLFWNLGPTSHGPPHEFTVQFTGDHPIARGLAPFRTKDELWLNPGVHPAAKVLATADGHTLAVTTVLGQGRGFALLLGHAAEFMDTPGFQALLARGAEWAATGKVTLGSAADAVATDLETILRRVAAYRFGDDRGAVLALERLVQAAAVSSTDKPQVAAKLATALGSTATVEGKRCLIEGLSLVGDAPEVPALAKALGDPELFYHARQALERMPANEAQAALETALGTTRGSARASLILSLANRRAAMAVPAIARSLADPDPEVAGAAIEALGRIGGMEAVAALETAEQTIAPALRERLAEAELRCAQSLQKWGRKTEAAALLAKLVGSGQPAAIRLAAFPWQVAALGPGGSAALLAALTGTDPVLKNAAVRALRLSRDPALLGGVVNQLAQLPPELQEPVVALCGERRETAALAAVTAAAGSAHAGVRRAAIETLGAIGNATTVEPLARLGDAASDDEAKAVVEALARLRGGDVESAILALLKDGPPPRQRVLIRALAARGATTATPALLTAVRSPDAVVRRDAIEALGRLAEAGACASVVGLLDQADGRDRGLLESALEELCRRQPAAVPAVVDGLSKVTPAAKPTLVSVLGSVGDATALTAVRTQLGSDHAEVRLAAVRVLAEWPDAGPLEDLAKVVETTHDPKARALAARGLNRLAAQAPGRAERAAEALARALTAATDPGEQQSCLAALIGVPSLPSLKAAQAQLKNPALAKEASDGLVKIAEVIYPWHVADVKAALAALKSAGPPSALAPRLQALEGKLDQPANFALGGLATSPDGLEKDGAAGGDQAAIDGNPETYWDEVDNQKLYRLRVQLRQRSTVGCLRLLGYAQQEFVPKDFEVLCGDRVVKTVTDAQYRDRRLSVEFPPVACEVVELRITGCYGPSPAIRELEIYERP